MDSEEIDDLFRAGLRDHSTPPADDLWARLQAQAADREAADPAGAERLDELFHTKLAAHPTPPRRELWERLEDEHLRPRKRRAVAWFPLALAAAVALLLVVGGGLFWSGNRLTRPAGSGVATVVAPTTATGAARHSAIRSAQPAAVAANAATTAPTDEQRQSASAASLPLRPPAATNFPAQATRRNRATSGVASTTVATYQAARRSAPPTPAAPRQLAAPAPVVAASPPTSPPDAAREVPTPTPAPVLASSTAVIEVEVRHGGEPGRATPAPAAVAASPATEPAQPHGRRLLNRILRQADRLVRGESLSLAEATGLPDNVTFRAQLGSRTLTKTIQL